MKRRKTIAEVLALANEKSAQLHSNLLKDLGSMERVYQPPNANEIVNAIKKFIDQFESHRRKSSRRRTDILMAITKYKTAAQSSSDVYRRLLRVIDGSPLEILSRGKSGLTSDDEFIERFYDAITNNSIRRWTRKNMEIIKATTEERESIRRKIGKLADRAKGDSIEAKTAAMKKREFISVEAALSHRLAVILRKFLQLRQIVMKTLVGATESIYLALGDDIPCEIVKRYGTEEDSAELAAADQKAANRRCA